MAATSPSGLAKGGHRVVSLTLPRRDNKGVKITMYHTPHNNQVYFKVEHKKRGGAKASTGNNRAGASVTEADITETHRVRASSYANNKLLLESKLTDLMFLEACKTVGVKPESLLPKPVEYFATKENRAERLPRSEQQEMFKHFERNRQDKLALVLSQEEKSIMDSKAREQDNAQYFQKLGQSFSTRLQQEEKALTAMDRARTKYERVLEHDNHQVVERRQTAMAREAILKNRYMLIDAMNAASVDQLHVKGQQRAALIKKNVETKRQEHDKAIAKMRKTQEQRLGTVNKFLDQRKKGVKSTAGKSKMVQQRNRRRLDENLAIQEQMRQDMIKRYHDKEKKMKKIQVQQMHEKEQKTLERQLDMKVRMQKAERIRKAKVYKRQRLIDAINNDNNRLAKVKEMNIAIQEKRRDVLREEFIRRDKWREANKVQRDITPGPGAYQATSSLKKGGGVWGKFTPKSEWDWIELNGGLTPGPGQYSTGRSALSGAGGVISEFRPKTDVEIAMARAAALPGPGQYEPKAVASKAGATFGNFDPKSELDMLISAAKELPGPGQYEKPMPNLQKPTLNDLKRRFNLGTATSMMGFGAKLKGLTGRTRNRLAVKDFAQTL